MIKTLMTAAACASAVLALSAAADATPTRETFSVVAVSYTSTKTATGEIFKEHLSIGGKRVGHDIVRCKARGARMLCRGTIYLRKGQIHVRVVAGGGPDARGTIVGGTGAYTGARGSVTLHGLPHNRDRITFTIT